MPQKRTIKTLKPEKLPPVKHGATTARPVSEEAQQIIQSALAESIRRARRKP
jgi:hypothetical protein